MKSTKNLQKNKSPKKRMLITFIKQTICYMMISNIQIYFCKIVHKVGIFLEFVFI